ncbi:hypothetical protein K502DRAFT_331302 [Neoconidiobolus thromboides FSU 785]|nr:hypothetical protein K502DRAFT_331302 [Neoconidiobolus thromboides FSU 785]
MKAILLFQLLIYLTLSFSPRANNGGCIILEDRLYYLGGLTRFINLDLLFDNKEVFELNLKKGVNLIGNVAEGWERSNVTNSPDRMYDPRLFYINKYNNANGIIMSSYVDGETMIPMLNFYNIKEKAWFNKNVFNEIFDASNTKCNVFKKCIVTYYILQKETRSSQFYISGSVYNKDLKKRYSLDLKLFDVQAKSIITVYQLKNNSYIRQVDIKHNKLYYFNEYSNNEYLDADFSILYELDLATTKIKEHRINFERYFSMQFITSNSSIYFAGTNFDNSEEGLVHIYELKISPFSFKRIKLRLPFNNFGCFNYYNDYLINTFGILNVFTKDGISSETTDKSQFINVKNWEQVGGLPSSIINNENSANQDSNKETNKVKNNSNNDYNNGLLIGSIVGGIIGFVLIASIVIFIMYKYKLKKQRPPSMIMDPIIIKPINPLDANNNYYNTEVFSHSHELEDDISHIIPEKLHIKDVRGMNMLFEE